MTTDLVSIDPVFSLATVLPSGPDQLILEFDAASVVTVSRDAWEQLVISLDGAIRRAFDAGLFSHVDVESGLLFLRVILTR